MRAIRRQIATETGVVVPPVHVADNLQLAPRGYAILVKGVEVARGELFADRLLAINPGTADVALDGTPTREPAFGLPAVWIRPRPARAARRPPASPWSIRRRRCRRTCRRRFATFLPDLLTPPADQGAGRPRRRRRSPKLIEELVPKLASIGDIQRVLRQLLRERVPIRDLTTILEAIADAAPATKDPDAVTEVGARGDRPRHLPAVSDREGRAADHLALARARGAAASRRSSAPSRARCSPSTRRRRSVWRAGSPKSSPAAVAQPVLLCTPTLRPHLWRLFARVLPHLGVLSHNEIPPQIQVASIATLD